MVYTGQNAPIETNDQGGKGSVTYGGFHLGFPAKGALEVSHVVKQGAERYAVNNWRLVSPEEHYNHAMEHLMRLGDPTEPSNDRHNVAYEDHAAHAACRLLMFLETRKPEKALAFHILPTPQAPPSTATSVMPSFAQMKALAEQLKPANIVPFPRRDGQIGYGQNAQNAIYNHSNLEGRPAC